MTQVVPLPCEGVIIDDVRGQGRGLRLSWHHAQGVAVLSVWRDGGCVASVRLRPDDAATLVDALAGGLVAGYAAPAQVHVVA